MRKRTRIIQDKRRRTRCAQLAADAFDEKLISVREEDGRTEIIMEGDAVTDMCGSTLFIQEPDTGDIFSENLKINLYSYRPGEGKKLAVPDIYGFNPAQKGESFCFTRLGENTDGQALRRCQEYSWNMVFAADEAEFNRLYEQMCKEVKELGYETMLDIDLWNAKKKEDARWEAVRNYEK